MTMQSPTALLALGRERQRDLLEEAREARRRRATAAGRAGNGRKAVAAMPITRQPQPQNESRRPRPVIFYLGLIAIAGLLVTLATAAFFGGLVADGPLTSQQIVLNPSSGPITPENGAAVRSALAPSVSRLFG